MRGPIIVFALPASPLGAALGAILAAKGRDHAILSLDAVQDGAPVTIGSDAVRWQGVDLLGASALVLEAPMFAWPQPLRALERVAAGAALQAAAVADREARSLAQSAILIAAARIPSFNPPSAAALAASPAIALDRLERQGLPVLRWRLDAQADANARDVAGRDRWHAPVRPRAGEPGIRFERGAHEVVVALVIGARIVGAFRHASVAAWADGREGRRLALDEVRPAVVELAARATASLALPIAAVAVAESPAPEILDVEVGPDLAGWDRSFAGAVAMAIADHVTSTEEKERS
jgi:hypothetical protein